MSLNSCLCTALITITALIACTAAPASTPSVGEIHLQMRPLDGEVLVRKDIYDKSSFAVKVLEGEQPLAGRIRILGSSSRQMTKRSFTIKFDKGTTWRGQTRLSLNAMASDPSLLRNWLSWEMFHALGMVAPQVAYRRVYINDKLQGIYLQTEWIEGPMFARQGLGGDGQFFHPIDSTFCGDLDKARRDDLDECWYKLEPDDKDFTPLASLIDAIDATPISVFDQFMEEQFDVESVINWLAVNVLTSNGDTYNKNYFLYRSRPSGKWTLIPWDYDLTYGRNYDPFLDYPHSVYNDNFQYFYPPELGAYSPLKEKVLRNPQLNARFKKRLAHLLGLQQEEGRDGFGIFSAPALLATIDQTAAGLLPEVQQDPKLRNEQENFHDNIEALKHYVLARSGYLKAVVFEVPWDPEQAYWRYELAPPPLPYPAHLEARSQGMGAVVAVADGYGYLLALFQPAEEGRLLTLSAQAELAQPPRQLPPGMTAESCIQRSWLVTLDAPAERVRGALTLEYFQENAQRHELGSLRNEQALKLWRYDQGQWQSLPTRVNALANTLTSSDLEFAPERPQRFVACTGGQDE